MLFMFQSNKAPKTSMERSESSLSEDVPDNVDWLNSVQQEANEIQAEGVDLDVDMGNEAIDFAGHSHVEPMVILFFYIIRFFNV